MNKILNNGYVCKYSWADDCFVQGNTKGVVFNKSNSYETAFFEAFPKNPNTFIRGEGSTIEEAEEVAWNKLQKHINCENHEFERRGYSNGAGFCKHCDLFNSHAFEPLHKCVVCGKSTYFTYDIHDNWYCEEHESSIKMEDMSSWQKEDYIKDNWYVNIQTESDIERLLCAESYSDLFSCRFFKSDISFIGDFLRDSDYTNSVTYISTSMDLRSYIKDNNIDVSSINFKVLDTKDDFNDDKYLVFGSQADTSKAHHVVYRASLRLIESLQP